MLYCPIFRINVITVFLKAEINERKKQKGVRIILVRSLFIPHPAGVKKFKAPVVLGINRAKEKVINFFGDT